MDVQKDIIVNEVQGIYERLDAQIALLGRACQACGRCCDFEAYGHRLYVTTPELLHFRRFAGDLKPMPNGTCPYRIEGQCSAYSYRFSGCRIFDCGTDALAQNQLCEETLGRLKALCVRHNFEYRYLYLKDALNMSGGA